MEEEATGSRDDHTLQERKLLRNELFTVLRNESFYNFSSSRCNEQLVQYVIDKFVVVNPSETLLKQIQYQIKVFVTKVMSKWRECNYMYDHFNDKHGKWLSAELKIPNIPSNPPTRPQGASSEKSRGRPTKTFQSCSDRSKQRKLKPLVSHYSSENLCSAAKISLVKSGKRNVAVVLELAINSTPKTLKRMRKAHDSSSSQEIKPYSAEEVLGLIVDLSLTKEDYITMRLGAKSRGANIYPSYQKVVQAKKECYPSNIRVSESEAVVPLQSLLDHTIQRLLQVQSAVILQNMNEEDKTLEIIYKWGLDGSGGHSIYKQNFSNNSFYADSNIILCAIVPLELTEKNGGSVKIYWKNSSPSSTRYCRPISFKLKKENDKNTQDEYNEVEQQIAQLQPTNIILGGRTIQVKHLLMCTMLDGKTVNVLTETKSSQTCNVCKATPISMNDLENVKKRTCDESTYKFGISVLHAYLRCYEYLLHIAYKLDIKQWQARGKEAQEKLKQRKNRIAQDFYNEMGLVIDQPKQGGGNSNDGNTARKFFKNPEMVSRITGIDKKLIERFSNILTVISCGHYINENEFRLYCFKTAEIATTLYEWYKMSASVHKLLIHGPDIIKYLPLPIGQLSEDVIETSQKSYKQLRQYHSRKTSRINTNADIFNWLLVSSDPIVTNHRKKPKKCCEKFNEVVLGMLRVSNFLSTEAAEEVASDVEDDDINEEDTDDDEDP